jgi:two-component system chemotaxis response regulator CheY
MTTTILVIDDALMVRKQVGNALAAMGYAVMEAIDGVDALEKLDDCPTTKLIVCDVHMPNMNGLEFLERLSERGSAIPVVMLTAEGEPDLIRRAKALGARAWIVKPFKSESLAAVVTKLAPITAPDPAGPAGQA